MKTIRIQESNLQITPEPVTSEKLQQLTPSESRMIQAARSKKVKDMENLMSFVRSCVAEAVLILGDGKKGEPEVKVIAGEVRNDLKNKFPNLTDQEFKIIMNMGPRGELKERETDIVHVSVACIYSWIKQYKKIKREALDKQRKLEEREEKEAEKTPEEKMTIEIYYGKKLALEEFERFKEGKVPNKGSTIYQFLFKYGILSPSDERKTEMYMKYREKLIKALSKSNFDRRDWLTIDQYRNDEFENQPRRIKQNNRFFREAARMAKEELVKEFFTGIIEMEEDLKQLLEDIKPLES